MADCKWMYEEFCVNADCPMKADYCPVANDPGVCRYEERSEVKVKNRVRVFKGQSSHTALECEINRYCEENKYNPISISVIWSAGTYVAFVVMEEWEG